MPVATPNSPTPKPERRGLLAPLRRKPGKSDTALEGVDLVVSTLRGIIALAPVPFVAEAAELVISIVDTIKDIKDNKEMFRHLCDDSYRLVYIAAEACQRLQKEGKVIPQDLLMDIARLVQMLQSINLYSQEKASRNLYTRILFKNHDLQEIRRFREELKQALDTFHVQTDITLRTDMKVLIDKVSELSKGLNQNGKAASTRTQSIHIADDSTSTDPRNHPKERSQSLDFRPSQGRQSPLSQVTTSPDLRPTSWPQHHTPPSSPPTSPPTSPTPSNPNNILANHPNPWVGWALSVANGQQQHMGSPLGQAAFYPQQTYFGHVNSPMISPTYVASPGSTNINSGTTTVNNTIGSNNNYSNNVYHY